MKRFLRTLVVALALGPALALAGGPVNINTADATALEQIKGIGPAKAKAIVEYRQQHGKFATTADLAKVPGIGDKTVEKLGDQITVGVPAPRTAAK
ncbi:ComEA family DNA-binding protein [Pseudothauera rhizosphaerae]|uniref:Helix-hairpin-helix domain-containing protein n=1 Tax=Pseudothauera rhizosphaerae TaxID=2565932 RepID=A0A4V3WA36_9RHOO|nr:ComEA family DNA-binding protein [Pseudothauera rhizosphaerae]THF57685.1 helix-hairpin-helix domain-containing protein [Pseudothauera rhizosphaerae]